MVLVGSISNPLFFEAEWDCDLSGDVGLSCDKFNAFRIYFIVIYQ